MDLWETTLIYFKQKFSQIMYLLPDSTHQSTTFPNCMILLKTFFFLVQFPYLNTSASILRRHCRFGSPSSFTSHSCKEERERASCMTCLSQLHPTEGGGKKRKKKKRIMTLNKNGKIIQIRIC